MGILATSTAPTTPCSQVVSANLLPSIWPRFSGVAKYMSIAAVIPIAAVEVFCLCSFFFMYRTEARLTLTFNCNLDCLLPDSNGIYIWTDDHATPTHRIPFRTKGTLKLPKWILGTKMKTTLQHQCTRFACHCLQQIEFGCR